MRGRRRALLYVAGGVFNRVVASTTTRQLLYIAGELARLWRRPPNGTLPRTSVLACEACVEPIGTHMREPTCPVWSAAQTPRCYRTQWESCLLCGVLTMLPVLCSASSLNSRFVEQGPVAVFAPYFGAYAVVTAVNRAVFKAAF